ncbi:Rrf2 family transcriptional regulator [Collinsella sp. AGMB00827]|uniref:Rrf2 family transcriptional regulator n=1 Tax=Collinsella ureilytica TaxID=2869515 RepID=A0ABS7MJR0_9ACTN|nr:Rrf2 family transcriptional regulator [Collinsella urealyticum]MBY4797611.1 Rrf2 family transcriptional regulator [Collinsella urealyticum]
MDISRKTDYAIRMLSMLVDLDESEALSVRIAAEQGDVPYSFARSIQHSLMHAGIIESLRGVRGGMRLKIDASTVTLRAIVEAVQGPIAVNQCTLPDVTCPREKGCCYHPVWVGAQMLLRNYLDSVTLADVVRGQRNPAVDPIFTDPERFSEYTGCTIKRQCVSSDGEADA